MAPSAEPRPPAPVAGQEPEDDKPELLIKLRERKERHARRGLPTRVGVVVIGALLVLAGAVMTGPVPGPGLPLILVGLSFLALEFDRAERLLERAIVWADNAKDRAENAPRSQKIAASAVGALLLGGFVVWAILDDIPLLPLV